MTCHTKFPVRTIVSALSLTIVIFGLIILWNNTVSNERSLLKVLEQAENVIEAYPDSVYALLTDYEATSADATCKALYGLLVTQAKYKLYIDSPDSLLPIIAQSEDYFRIKADKRRLCKSLYYHSMMLYKTGAMDQALLKLKEGLSIAEALSDTLQMAKYYESLCMLNDKARCHELMQMYAKKMLNLYLATNNNEAVARSLNNLATAYWRLEMPDSAFYYRKQALPLLDSISEINKAYLLTNLASDFIHAKNYETARQYLQKAASIAPQPNTFKMLGDIYEKEGMNILAQKCWKRAMEIGSPQVRLRTLNSIITSLIAGGNDKLAIDAYQQYIELNDSIQKDGSQVAIAELQAKYDYEVIKNSKNNRIVRLQFILIAFLVIFIISWWWHKKRVWKYENQIEAKEILIRQKESAISSLSDDICNKEKRTIILQNEIAQLQSTTLERLGKGREIYTSVKNGGRISNSVPEAEQCFIDFFVYFQNEKFTEWRTTYGALTPRLITYLILDDMGFDDTEKERVLGVGRAAIGMTKTRLKRSRKK